MSVGLPDSWAVFDLETTGLDPKCDSITELAWLIVRDGVPCERFAALNSGIREIPLDVQRITGITPELCQTEGKPLRAVMEHFLYECAGLPLVGHNIVRFDALFLEAHCRARGRPAPARSRYIDTAALYKGRKLDVWQASEDHWRYAEAILGRKVWNLKYNLQAACTDLGIPTADVTLHRAAGDVELTNRLYTALTAEQVPA